MEEKKIVKVDVNDSLSVDCEVLGTFEVGFKEYIVLVPADGTDDLFIYRYELNDQGEREMVTIEDGVEFSIAMVECENFMARLAEEEGDMEYKTYNLLEVFTQQEISKLFPFVGPGLFQDEITEDVYQELKAMLESL